MRDAISTLESVLPSRWKVDETAGDRGDITLTLTSTSGHLVTYVVEARYSGRASARDTAAQSDHAARVAGLPALVVTDYANPTLRAALDSVAVSYVDTTGWMHIQHDDPALLLVTRGADRAPRRTSSTVRNLGGRAASAVVRELLTTTTPVGVRRIAERAGTHAGSVSKVLPTLEADGTLVRDDKGAVLSVRRRALFERWIQDYSFLTSNGVVLDYVAPRGVSPLVAELAKRPDVCLTGSAASRTYLPTGIAPALPLTHVACYVDDPAGLAAELGLVRADRWTSNVLLTAPTERAFLDAPRVTTPRTAPLVQVMADLYSLPGRGAAEAEQHLDLLADDDETWS